MRKLLIKITKFLIEYCIINSTTKLTREYLLNRGWMFEEFNNEIYWVEKHIKERDKIFIKFDGGFYRIYHGKNKTFIGLENSLEFFEIYYSLLNMTV